MNIIELVGYLGSLLVLVSFLMTSVFRLRVVNTIGSIIFAIYALIIKSYPTALMNFCLVLINLHFLWKMRSNSKEYELVEVANTDNYLVYLLEHFKDDIEECFPKISYKLKDINKAWLITHESAPVGITMGTLTGDTLELALDYSIPSYRDFSIGSFLFQQLKAQGIKTICYRGPSQEHGEYLARMGFVKQKNGYIKNMDEHENE